MTVSYQHASHGQSLLLQSVPLLQGTATSIVCATHCRTICIFASMVNINQAKKSHISNVKKKVYFLLFPILVFN